MQERNNSEQLIKQKRYVDMSKSSIEMKKEFTDIIKNFNTNHPFHSIERESAYWPVVQD